MLHKLVLGVVLALSLNLSLKAQEDLGPAGRTDTSSGYSISWNLGETGVVTTTKNELIFTEGFEQPHFVISSIEKKSLVKVKLSVFPNPTTRVLNIHRSSGNTETFSYELVSTDGKTLSKIQSHESQVSINVQGLPSATYFLLVTSSSQTFFEKFSIVKSR
jgi:hypothetical protein